MYCLLLSTDVEVSFCSLIKTTRATVATTTEQAVLVHRICSVCGQPVALTIKGCRLSWNCHQPWIDINKAFHRSIVLGITFIKLPILSNTCWHTEIFSRFDLFSSVLFPFQSYDGTEMKNIIQSVSFTQESTQFPFPRNVFCCRLMDIDIIWDRSISRSFDVLWQGNRETSNNSINW